MMMDDPELTSPQIQLKPQVRDRKQYPAAGGQNFSRLSSSSRPEHNTPTKINMAAVQNFLSNKRGLDVKKLNTIQENRKNSAMIVSGGFS